ncbi:hypothetical protein [Clostridium guangxiense]|uniref:hypothetical protein n=1 Tax=Clostridium guangxiense TaxID=1662055 RepID=UPI001E51A9CD|nr:hypothetical protein [Clostridium guangxiense]MCD2345603.1 hypothetical protein [Clostridium guangxiense]
MRKVLISVFVTLFVMLSLTGCNQNQIQDRDASPNSKLSQNMLTKKGNTTSNYSLNKLKSNQPQNSISNINSRLDNGEEFIKTFNTLKAATLKNDKETISDYVNYPLIVYINGNKTKISNKTEFINNYDNIFNSKIKNSLKNQQLSNLKITPNGVIVGNGEVYLNLINNGKHEYGIYSINNR